MQKQILAATALMAAIVTLAPAQTTTTPTPPTPAQIAARQVARLTKLLDLTASQQTSATTIFTAEQTTLATVRTSMQTARTALQAAIKINDTNTIGTDATQIGTLTGEEVQAQATAAGAFYAILMADQQTKYETLGPLGGGPGGPGGFGGPGPGGPGPHGFGGSH
ncbi:MAG TPA: Spy/CpxP family protein refolding chaperone [Bryobacteraceae bacterium]|nr:Spy/CpxP family protein refolding chaperone [Bryobacteraceae bacterium]